MSATYDRDRADALQDRILNAASPLGAIRYYLSTGCDLTADETLARIRDEFPMVLDALHLSRDRVSS